MVYIRFHLPVLLSSYSIVNSNINYNFIRLCSICLIFLPQIISSSFSKYDERAVTIAKSIDEYHCQTRVLSCFFRARYHQLSDNQQLSEKCKPFLILHLCYYYDTDTIRLCTQSTLNQAKINLDKEKIPRHCFTSSVYKTLYAQHLHSIAPSRTIIKCQIFVLFFLLISFIIKIRACC